MELGHDYALSGSRDAIGHVTIRYHVCHLLWVPVVIESLSLAVFKITALEDIEVMYVTFRDHVT